jgi:hypothetical protein
MKKISYLLVFSSISFHISIKEIYLRVIILLNVSFIYLFSHLNQVI